MSNMNRFPFPLTNTTTSKESHMLSTRPFVTRTENGFCQTGFALLDNGYWATRASGTHIWAMTPDRAMALAAKVSGKATTTPPTFVQWGVFEKAKAPAAAPAPVAAPGPFAEGAPRSTGHVQATVTRVEEPKVRSAAQCAATLRLTSSNAMRCERGEIGGDLGKARKGVLTALASYTAACGREGRQEDAEMVENAMHAAGVDIMDVSAGGL